MDLSALALSVALGYNTYTGEDVRAESPAAFSLRLGHEELPVYLWGSYDNNETGFLGQPFSKNDVMGFGFGARKSFGDFRVFAELGYATVDQSTDMRIQQEVVYTELVRNHNVYNRPVPVQLGGPYDQDSYSTVYEIDDGYLARVGLGWELTEHLGVSVAYRMFRPETYYNIQGDSISNNSTATWEENTTTNLDAFELAVEWSF